MMEFYPKGADADAERDAIMSEGSPKWVKTPTGGWELEPLASATPSRNWTDPDPIGAGDLPVFPVKVLGSKLAPFVSELSEELQCPADLTAMAALGTVSAAVVGKYQVSPRRKWTEEAALYLLSSASPGENKSAAISRCTRELRAADLDLAAKGREARTERKIRLATLDDEIREAKKEPEKRARLMREKEDLQAAEPAEERILCDDTTPEKLAVIMGANNGAAAVIAAEGGFLQSATGKLYGNAESNLEALLRGYSGEPLRVDRMGRPSLFVHRATLSICLAVQPRMAEMLRGEDVEGRGLSARFLVAQPLSRVGHRSMDAVPASDAAEQAYHHHIAQLVRLPRPSGDNAVPIVIFADDAADMFRRWREEIEGRLVGDLDGLREWGAKLGGQTARIAGLLHSAKNVAPWDRPIDGDTMTDAIKLTRYFVEHEKALLGVAAGAQRDAADLLGWIRRHAAKGEMRFTMRDVQRSGPNRLREDDKAKPGICELVQAGWIRPEPVKTALTGGRQPSPAYEIHPSIRKGAKP